MSTSTQPEGTEANPAENTSEQSHGETEILVPDKYQIVALAPVEFFTTKRLNLARDNHKSNHSGGVEDLEKARVRDIEEVIRDFTNLNYKVYTEQIDLNYFNQIDVYNLTYDVEDAKKIADKIETIIKEGMKNKEKNGDIYFETIFDDKFIEYAKDYIKKFYKEDGEKFKDQLNQIDDIADIGKEKLRELMEYEIEKSFQAKLRRKNQFEFDLRKQLKNIVPKSDKVNIAQINLLIAEAKVNMEAKKPINEIFNSRYRMSRDLPDVRTVLRDAERELSRVTEYCVEDSFWDELNQNLRDVTPKNDENIVAKIEELIAEAKNNIEAKKPINEIFGNRYRMPQDLPDVNTVLRDAEKKIYNQAEYLIEEDFLDELKQKPEAVSLKDDNVAIAQINLLIAQAKANIEAKKPINEIFSNRYKILRTVLRDAEEKLREHAENNVKEEFWDELRQNLRDVTPKNDENIVANIEGLIAEAKNNIEAKKPINKIFGNKYRMSRDLPDVRTVLRDAEEKLREHAENNVKEEFWDELRQNLRDVTPKNDENIVANIEGLIAEAKANIKTIKPINEIFGNRYRVSRDLPDVRTVLRDAKRELREHEESNVKKGFWDELKQNLETVTQKDNNVAIAQIDLLIAQAKANIKAKKPIAEIFEDRHRMSRDLPDVRSVLRNAEREMNTTIKYSVLNEFWEKLKQDLEKVNQKNDKVAIAQINLLIAEAKASIEAKKPIDEIFESGYRILRDFPDTRTILNEAERKLSETTEYCIGKKFWRKLKKSLKKVTLRKRKNINVSLNKLIIEAKNNMEEKKPVNEIFFNLERELRNFDDVNAVLKEFKKKIIISYNIYDKTFDNFINFLKGKLKDLNKNMIIYGKVNEKIEKTKNDLDLLKQKLSRHEESILQEHNASILQEIEKLDKNDGIEDNIKAIEKVIENLQSSDAIEANNSFQDSSEDEIVENVQKKLNELYNESIFASNYSASGNKYMEERVFWSKLSKHLLVEEILVDFKTGLNAKHIKSVDILAAIPQNPSYSKIENETKTGIVLLLIIDIDMKKNQELYSNDFEMGELFLDPINVRTILNLIVQKFHIGSESSKFNELLGDKSFIKDTSILHIVSCSNFDFSHNKEDARFGLSLKQQNLIKKIIPRFFIDRDNQEKSELIFIPKKNLDSIDNDKISSALISYLNQSLAIVNQDNSSAEGYRNQMIGLQIVFQSFLQRLSQYNDVLRSIAIAENRDDLFDNKTETSMFNNQLHYTYTIPDEVINLSKQHSDIAVLRELLTSTTITHQIDIFKERREAFFSIKENYEKQQRDKKTDKMSKIIEWTLVGFACITVVFSILELIF